MLNYSPGRKIDAMHSFNKDGEHCAGVQVFRLSKWIRERDETEVDQGWEKREKTMPWQHVADRHVAVQCHLWRDALFSRVQRQLEMKKARSIERAFRIWLLLLDLNQ